MCAALSRGRRSALRRIDSPPIRSVVKGSPVRNRRGPATVTGSRKSRAPRAGAGHWGAPQRAPGRRGRAAPEARRPVPGQPIQPSRKGRLQCQDSFQSGWRPRARWPCSCSSRPRPIAAAKKVEADLRVVAKGKVIAEETLKTGTISIPTSRKADCFGKGTGGCGKAAKIAGPTALGLLGQAATSTGSLQAAADHRRLRLRPRDLRRRQLQRHEQGILVPEGQPQEPGNRRRAGQAEAGRRSPLGARQVPLPEGAGARSARPKRPRPCRSRSASSPTTTRASASRSRGRWSPAAPGPTDAQGKTTVTVAGPSTIRATHAKDIPSNGVGVCVLAVCP